MSKHTPGPWRWEFNSGSRNLHLVGGRPRYDLTIMDFARWGMDGATVRLRDTEHERLQLMHKLHERTDWIKPFEGRAHHADWCADVTHPDMRLIAAAPELLEMVDRLLSSFPTDSDMHAAGWEQFHIDEACAAYEAARALVKKATGPA